MKRGRWNDEKKKTNRKKMDFRDNILKGDYNLKN